MFLVDRHKSFFGRVRKRMAQQDTLLRCSVGTDLPAQARKIRQGPRLT